MVQTEYTSDLGYKTAQEGISVDCKLPEYQQKSGLYGEQVWTCTDDLRFTNPIMDSGHMATVPVNRQTDPPENSTFRQLLWRMIIIAKHGVFKRTCYLHYRALKVSEINIRFLLTELANFDKLKLQQSNFFLSDFFRYTTWIEDSCYIWVWGPEVLLSFQVKSYLGGAVQH